MSITIFSSTSVNVIEKLTIVLCDDIDYAVAARIIYHMRQHWYTQANGHFVGVFL